MQPPLRSLPPFIARLNIKIKFLYFCGLLLLTLLSKNSLFLVLLLGFHLLFLLTKRENLKELIHLYLEPLFVAFILVLLKGLDFSSFQSTLYNLKDNLFLGLRVLSAFTLFLFFYASLGFFEIIKLMNWLRISPFFQELFFLSYKFITLLKGDLSLVYLSQKNRLGYMGFRKSLSSLKYLVQASFFRALRHTEETLQSMQQRGFDFKNLPRTTDPLKVPELFYLLFALSLWTLLWIII